MASQTPVALVTGAGLRLGRAIALALGGRGYDVAVHYGSSRSAAEETVADLEAMGRRAWALQADLADLEALAGLFDALDDRTERLDVLVNNAARFDSQAFDRVEPSDWDATMSVNLRAPFFAMQQAARRMRRRESGGCIVNLADLSGVTPWLGYSVHGASKAGLVFLTRSAARELGPEVRVNAVLPGPILPPPGEDPSDEAWLRRGEHLPLGRTGRPADVSEAVLYLVTADYVTGAVLPVDGGEHLGPLVGR